MNEEPDPRKEAARRWPQPDPFSMTTYSDEIIRMAVKRAFVEGAEWHAGFGDVVALTRWKEQALMVMSGLQDLGEALDVPLGHHITGAESIERARALVAERDALKERIDAALKYMRNSSTTSTVLMRQVIEDELTAD